MLGPTDLYIPVQELSRMHVFKRLEQLVHDILLVDLLQNIRADHCMQVCLHVLKHQVDVPVVLCLHDVQQPARHEQNSILQREELHRVLLFPSLGELDVHQQAHHKAQRWLAEGQNMDMRQIKRLEQQRQLQKELT